MTPIYSVTHSVKYWMGRFANFDLVSLLETSYSQKQSLKNNEKKQDAVVIERESSLCCQNKNNSNHYQNI